MGIGILLSFMVVPEATAGQNRKCCTLEGEEGPSESRKLAPGLVLSHTPSTATHRVSYPVQGPQDTCLPLQMPTPCSQVGKARVPGPSFLREPVI